MIDRRKLLGWGLGAGASLAGPTAVMAAVHGHAKPHLLHHAAVHRGVTHASSLAEAAAQPLHSEVLRAAEPLQLEPVRFEARRIILKNVHTDEALDAVYWERGAYVPDALTEVNRVLRDFRTGDVHPIDPQLLDLATDLHAKVGSNTPFQVISGYRSPKTNAMLHEQSAEVAKHSLHMDGMAIDLFLEDVDLSRLHEAALDLGRGGVGYYPRTSFVHVDVGPVRHWQGV